MSIFESKKVCLFSNISGVILNDGIPVANALVTRKVRRGEWTEDNVYTDENGKFEMQALYERGSNKLIPREFVVSQEVYVDLNGRQEKFWQGIKRSEEENYESQGNPLVVECDLSWEEKFIMFDNQPFTTKCKWNVEPDEPFDINKIIEEED